MLASCRAMTHSNDAQCRPVRLDQDVSQDPGLYSRPDFYSRKCGRSFRRRSSQPISWHSLALKKTNLTQQKQWRIDPTQDFIFGGIDLTTF